jgi:hypothetical protein
MTPAREAHALLAPFLGDDARLAWLALTLDDADLRVSELLNRSGTQVAHCPRTWVALP